MGKDGGGIDKIIDPSSGKLTIIKKEERYPYSTSILMDNGFFIILFNMIFGLLPTTLFGSRLKYYRCSVAQAYAVSFGLCMLLLSMIFVPVSINTEIAKRPFVGRTDVAVLIIVKFTHVVGFLFLLIQGRGIARKMPDLWNQLSKLLQHAIVEVHGEKYRSLKKLKRFGQYLVGAYFVVMFANQLNMFGGEMSLLMPQFFILYDLRLIEITEQSVMFISAGFFIWKLCSFSHVLVSIMTSYMVVCLCVSLKSMNDHLLTLFRDENNVLLQSRKKRRMVIAMDDEWGRGSGGADQINEKLVLASLARLKVVYVMAENLAASISKVFGVSLIIEVLILISNTLVSIFYILSPLATASMGGGHEVPTPVSDNNETLMVFSRVFKEYSEQGAGGGGLVPDDELNAWGGSDKVLTLLGEAFIHSFFFYKLCCKATEMVNEAKETLQILKMVPNKNYSQDVQSQIEMMKGDMASTTLALTAGNYFQINKFTLTSVTSALTTYIIVLLQFNAQDSSGQNQP